MMTLTVKRGGLKAAAVLLLTSLLTLGVCGIAGPADQVEAAQVALTAAERDLLAQLVRAEGEGEPYVGKVAIAAVVLNRVRSDKFPNTVAGVIYQPRQFEPVANGRIYRPATAEDYRAVDDALRGWDPTGGAVYFFNPSKVSNGFLWSRPYAATIGGHRFTY